MYDNRTHSVPDRIVSVSHPFVRPIVRGKAGKPVEFGAKLDISVVDGWTRLECYSFDAYNEAGNLQEMAERFREREGITPVAFWRTRFAETVKISAIARSTESDSPAQHWDVPGRVRPETRLRITGMSASVWK